MSFYEGNQKMQALESSPEHPYVSNRRRELEAEYDAMIEALEGRPEDEDEGEDLKWSVVGIDRPHMRRIVRQSHRGRDTVYWINAPGLIAAIQPGKRWTRNAGTPGVSDRSRSWTDADLVDKFTGVMTHRGRGLLEHDELVIAEMRSRCAYLPGLAPLTLPAAIRARAARSKLGPIASAIMDYVARARSMGRAGLDYTNAGLAHAIDCHPRSVRRSIADLEQNGLVWRHATSRSAIDEQASRPVDQDRNLLIPGPRWVREIDPWCHADWDARAELEAEASRRYRRRRAARARRVKLGIPDRATWIAERLEAEAEVDDICREMDWLGDVSTRDIASDDAAAIVRGELTPLEAIERVTHREQLSEELATKVDALKSRYSRDKIEQSRHRLSSNWEDSLSTRPFGTTTRMGRSRPGATRPEPTAPTGERPRPALALVQNIGDFDDRSPRGGDWYDEQSDAIGDARGMSYGEHFASGQPRQYLDPATVPTTERPTRPQSAEIPPTQPQAADGLEGTAAAPMRDSRLSKLADDLLSAVRARNALPEDSSGSKNFFFGGEDD